MRWHGTWTSKHLTGSLAWLPSQCALCHTWPSQVLCGDCLTRFKPRTERCITCAMALPQGSMQCGTCLRHPPPLTRCTTFTDYAYPWDQCIARLKFQEEPAWAAVLANLMAQNPSVSQLLEQADGVIGIPLAPQRLQERGYNQSALIASHLAAGKALERTLLRIKHDPPQSQVSRLSRLRQLRHAFLVEPTLSESVNGKHLVLVDDVMTTGATLFEAARTLLQAGARQVDAAVFARTPHL